MTNRRNERARARRLARKRGWVWNRRTQCWFKKVFREGCTQVIKIRSVLEIFEWEADEAAAMRLRFRLARARAKNQQPK